MSPITRDDVLSIILIGIFIYVVATIIMGGSKRKRR